MKDKLVVKGVTYPVYIYFEKRKGTRVSIGKTGIRIRVPNVLSREERWRQILQMKQWARKKLEEKPLVIKRKGWKTYSDGDKIEVGGDEYLLRITKRATKGSSAKVRGNTIALYISILASEQQHNEHVSVLLSRVFAGKNLPYITKKIHELNKKHFNFSVRKVFLKYNLSNWGSCSRNGNINISTRLLFAPEEVINYVCIHELAHLQEKNHYKDFWELVEKAMPYYKEKKQWLKENSDNCWF